MLKERFGELYEKVEEKKKVFLCVCAALILLSGLRFFSWATRRARTAGTRAYIQQVRAGSPEEKKYALFALGQSGNERAAPEVAQALEKDSRDDVKRVAAWSLGLLDTEKLASYLSSGDRDIREIVMETLMKLDASGNIGYLLARLEHEDREGRLRILGYMDSADKAGFASEILRIAENTREDADVRKKALEMLKTRDIEMFENRLWNIYYNDSHEGVRETARSVIQGIRR